MGYRASHVDGRGDGAHLGISQANLDHLWAPGGARLLATGQSHTIRETLMNYTGSDTIRIVAEYERRARELPIELLFAGAIRQI